MKIKCFLILPKASIKQNQFCIFSMLCMILFQKDSSIYCEKLKQMVSKGDEVPGNIFAIIWILISLSELAVHAFKLEDCKKEDGQKKVMNVKVSLFLHILYYYIHSQQTNKSCFYELLRDIFQKEKKKIKNVRSVIFLCIHFGELKDPRVCMRYPLCLWNNVNL